MDVDNKSKMRMQIPKTIICTLRMQMQILLLCAYAFSPLNVCNPENGLGPHFLTLVSYKKSENIYYIVSCNQLTYINNNFHL
jgi:hypothetical protein